MAKNKKNVVLNEEEIKYLNMFHESDFSPYDFICLFSAINMSQNNFSFNRDKLIQYISFCKKNNQFDELLNDIQINNNGVFDYSNALEEAIQKLKLGRILYTISPEQNSQIYMFKNIVFTNLIENREKYKDKMELFIKKFNKYTVGNNCQLEQSCNEQEQNKKKKLKSLKKKS